MIRIWHIGWHEYRRHLTRRSYLLFTFGFPLFMLGAPVVGFLMLVLVMRSALPPTDPRPIGLVDQAGLLAGSETLPGNPVAVKRFASPEAAAAALAAGQIQAYYDIQPDYWHSGEIILTHETAPSEAVRSMFSQWVQQRVRAEVPPEILARLDGGAHITHQDLAGRQTYALARAAETVLVYLLIYFVRLAASFTAEYMFGSMASEAYDRTLEILITSVSPLEFVTGKLLGLLAVGFTQLGMWAGVLIGLSLAAGSVLGFDPAGFLLRWEHLGLLISVLLGAYLLDQILAAALGLLKVSGGAGTLLFSSLNSIIAIALLYAAYFVPRNPHTPLAVVASLFPITAPLVLLIRVVVSEVPAWQIILSQILLWGSCLASIFWLRRLLQANLVRSGAGFSLRRWVGQRLLKFEGAALLRRK